MTGPLLLGAGFGLALAGLLVWAAPPRRSLAAAFRTLHPPTAETAPAPVLPVGVLDASLPGWLAVLGRPAAPLLARLGLPRASVAADLAVCGRDSVRHLGEQAALALIGFVVVPVAAAALSIGGIGVAWPAPVWVGILGAAAGVFVPDLALSAEATRRRTELREAVAGMLDLVVISLAGGAGVEQALRDATAEPASWADRALGSAIDAAHLTRRPPWATIGALGERTGVTTLTELSAALSLAGTEGARIRATLTARSAALSAHHLADAETAALTATERMVLPVVALFIGFLLFLGFPAFEAVLHAF